MQSEKHPYSHEHVEQAAQTYWRTHQCFKAEEQTDKEAFYCLAMLPYPSGHYIWGMYATIR